jgi:hypothetical protein
MPPVSAAALVPAGLVSSRVIQLAGRQDGNEVVREEMIKKQKRTATTNDARSAAAADGSPRRAQ